MQHKVEECAFVFEALRYPVLVTEPIFRSSTTAKRPDAPWKPCSFAMQPARNSSNRAVDFDTEVARQSSILTEILNSAPTTWRG